MNKIKVLLNVRNLWWEPELPLYSSSSPIWMFNYSAFCILGDGSSSSSTASEQNPSPTIFVRLRRLPALSSRYRIVLIWALPNRIDLFKPSPHIFAILQPLPAFFSRFLFLYNYNIIIIQEKYNPYCYKENNIII